MPEAVLTERDGAVCIVTLNRPDQLNAFNDELHEAVPAVLRELDDDDSVRAIVLTGAGRAFSAGGDLGDFERYRVDFEARRAVMRRGRRLVDDMLTVTKPVIAAINGPAVGLGCTVAALCDIVFIADTAFMADPHIGVGLVAGDGNAVSWPFMTSMLNVKRYLLTGDRIPAETAVAIGMANEVVPKEDVVRRAVEFGQRLSDLPPQAVQDTKATLNQHLRLSAVATLGMGLAATSQSHDTSTYRDLHRDHAGTK